MSAVEVSAGRTSDAGPVLAPILGVVFVGFLVTGMALPVLPLHVHQTLGLGLGSVFLVSTAVVALAAVIAAGMLVQARTGDLGAAARPAA